MSPSTVTPRSPSYPAFQAIERQPQVFVDRFRQEGDSLVGPRDERQVLLEGAHRRDGNPGEIGRASCRERVSMSVAAAPWKKTNPPPWAPSMPSQIAVH